MRFVIPKRKLIIEGLPAGRHRAIERWAWRLKFMCPIGWENERDCFSAKASAYCMYCMYVCMYGPAVASIVTSYRISIYFGGSSV